MMLNASFPAEVHVLVSDDWLGGDDAAVAGNEAYGVDSVGAYFDCRKMWNAVTNSSVVMQPRGVNITSGEATGKFYAVINGYLWNENFANRDDFPIPSGGLMHSIRLLRIYRTGTTARGIRIYG